MSLAASTTQKLSTDIMNLSKTTRKQRKLAKEVTCLREKSSSILPATTFKRIVTQEGRKCSTEPLRWNSDAVQALQTATEDELTTIFSGAAFCAGIAKRDTITVEDMRNYQALRDLK